MNLKAVSGVLLLALIVIVVPAVSQGAEDELDCRIVTPPDTPNAGETVLFTISNGTKGVLSAHAARPDGPGAYPNKVVCEEIDSKTFTDGSCPVGESGVLSLHNYTNAHVETFGVGNYPWNVCASSSDPGDDRNELTPVVRDSCESYESGLVSFQSSLGSQTNAHVARPDVYEHNLCVSRRCEGSSCVEVQSTSPEAFSPTEEWATFEVELFNRDPVNDVTVELYLANKEDYETGTFSQYGDWEFRFDNGTHVRSLDEDPVTVTVGPEQTETALFEVKAPPRAPPSAELEPYSFIVAVR